MAAVSIREMNITLVAREQAVDAVMKLQPRSKDPVYYWSIYRKVLRGKGKYGDGWKFVRDFSGTKAQVAELWNKYFRDGNHRLRCELKY
jgi:hypothetical protein